MSDAMRIFCLLMILMPVRALATDLPSAWIPASADTVFVNESRDGLELWPAVARAFRAAGVARPLDLVEPDGPGVGLLYRSEPRDEFESTTTWAAQILRRYREVDDGLRSSWHRQGTVTFSDVPVRQGRYDPDLQSYPLAIVVQRLTPVVFAMFDTRRIRHDGGRGGHRPVKAGSLAQIVLRQSVPPRCDLEPEAKTNHITMAWCVDREQAREIDRRVEGGASLVADVDVRVLPTAVPVNAVQEVTSLAAYPSQQGRTMWEKELERHADRYRRFGLRAEAVIRITAVRLLLDGEQVAAFRFMPEEPDLAALLD